MNRYESLEAELHDLFWNEEECGELPVLERFFAAYPGRALEAGCGSGRLLLPLLAGGVPIEGLEPSADMLALCRRQAEERSLEPVLHAGMLAAFHDAEGFDAIAVPAFTIQLTEDPAAAFRELAALLKPEGGLYVTIFHPFAELDGELPQGEWYTDHQLKLADGGLATVETLHTLDAKNRTLHRRHRYTITGPDEAVLREHESEQTIHHRSLPAWKKALRDAGLTLVDAFAEFDPAEKADGKSQIVTFIARK